MVASSFPGEIGIPPNSSESDSSNFRKMYSPAVSFETWMLRLLLVVCAGAICSSLNPFGLHGVVAIGTGVMLAMAILVVEMRLRWAAPRGLLGGALGAVLGIFAAVLVTLVVSRTAEPERTKSFLEYGVLVAFAYLGGMLGSEKAAELRLETQRGPTERKVGAKSEPPIAEPEAKTQTLKLLDTSVLIDGRIADVCEAQFLDGPLLVPQFVLHELQLVADSGDTLKRQRGRRGLDVLERIRKMPRVEVRVIENHASQAGDVDHKLVEVALEMGAKIVTNDFNLNKVATVQGIAVLNVNQLANALKPVVLPGEPMRVLILREGKEANQGVAYLDDGTMVVVDGAKRFINRSVDILVTSVHQTTAGKMIFGRMDERAENGNGGGAVARRAATAGAGAGAGQLPGPAMMETGMPSNIPVDEGG
jgi:uncharacterized protein YacL